MNNNYYIMRHGESVANKEKKIISNPDIGTVQYGLTENGKSAVLDAFSSFDKKDLISRIISSDFLRAMETAELVLKESGINTIEKTILLRERFFGNYDSCDDECYNIVWDADKSSQYNCDNGVESPYEVAERVKKLLSNCEENYENETILFVSHGDTLQIMQTVFSGQKAHTHREIRHLEKAEIRHLGTYNRV